MAPAPSPFVGFPVASTRAASARHSASTAGEMRFSAAQLDARARSTVFAQIIANNRAGGWRTRKRDAGGAA